MPCRPRLIAAVAIAGCAALTTAGASGAGVSASRVPPPRWVQVAPDSAGLLLRWDRNLSPAAGADNLLFAYGAFGRLEDRLLPTRLFEEERFAGRALSIAYRLGKVACLDLPAAQSLPLVQHEVFGHGWRAREEGYGHIRYDLSPPPPYGPGEGLTSWTYPDGFAPTDDSLMLAQAGIEAEDILAKRQRDLFLRGGSLDLHGALLYFASSLGLADYVRATSGDETDMSNDVAAWLSLVNGKAGRDRPADRWISREDLERRTLLSLADPFLWYSGGFVLDYIWDGRSRRRYPMIPFGPARWLPGLGYRLSPFGGQYLAENLVVLRPRVAVLRAAWGSGELGASWGADLETRDLARWRGYSLDAAVRAWSQPVLRPEAGSPGPSGSSRFGAGLSAEVISPALFPGFPLRLAAGFSAKRPGYVPGESLGADFAWRAGVGAFR